MGTSNKASPGHLSHKVGQGKDRHYFKYLDEYKALKIKQLIAFDNRNLQDVKECQPRLKHLRAILGIGANDEN